MTTATLTPADRPAAPPPPPPPAPARTGRERVALAALLVATAATYLWNLSANGWGNEFYAGAVQAMTKNWTAFFFGSSDAGNTVTVDKPPAALWVQALAARAFGLSSWSILVPQALMAVATVALLYAAVRRVAGPHAALLTGAAMALTPVAALMFRFDNPDALLTLTMTAAAYAVVRALERAGTRWLLLAGALMGLAFLTKTAASFLVLPGLALAYLWAAPTGAWRRMRQLLAAGVALVVTAGWWFLAAAMWPAGSRPYIGGSTDNSALELAFGYNGLSRIFGRHFGGTGPRGGFGGERAGDLAGGVPAGGVPAGPPGGFPGGGPGGGGPFGSGLGIGRLFTTDNGGQISWLLPAALILLGAGLLLTRRAARTDPLRASLLLWGGWTVVTALVFSFMEGIYHQYYSVALAPGIAALVGIGAALLWGRREAPWVRVTLAATVIVTAGWAWVLLDRTPTFVPWLKWVVLVLGLVGAALLVLPARSLARGGLAAAVLAGLLGPAAYTADTVATAHTGSIVLAGPATSGGFGFGGRGAGGDRRGFRDGVAEAGATGGGATGSGTTGSSATGGGATGGGATGGGTAPGAGGFGPGGFGGPGGAGPGDGQVTDRALVDLLRSAGTKWSAATTGAMSAAPLALASGTDVMGIGGFMGSDPAPTLAAFQADVARGEIHYFVTGGGPGGGRGGPGGESGISTWVQQHYAATTVGGRTVYDLTKPTS